MYYTEYGCNNIIHYVIYTFCDLKKKRYVLLEKKLLSIFVGISFRTNDICVNTFWRVYNCSKI